MNLNFEANSPIGRMNGHILDQIHNLVYAKGSKAKLAELARLTRQSLRGKVRRSFIQADLMNKAIQITSGFNLPAKEAVMVFRATNSVSRMICDAAKGKTTGEKLKKLALIEVIIAEDALEGATLTSLASNHQVFKQSFAKSKDRALARYCYRNSPRY